MKLSFKKGRRQSTAVVLLVYALLTVLMTWPLAAQLGTLVPAGVGNDVSVHLWTFWWVKQAIKEGHNPFYTNFLFYPYGVSLAYHNIAWLNIAVWLPLQAIMGGYTAYSLVFMGFIALNGCAMYFLAREWTGSAAAAFIAGLIYGFWPFTLSRSGQPNIIVVCWIPLALLYLRRTVEKGHKRDAVLTAIFLVLTGMARWHLLIMGGVIVGLYLLYKCLTDSDCRTWRTFGLLMLIGLLVMILLAPLAAPIIIAQMTQANPEDIFIDKQSRHQTDLLAYVFPNHNLSLWGRVASRLGKINTQDRVPFLGYTAIILAFYGMMKNWRSTRFWVLVAMVYLALALGPQLRFYNRVYPQVPMPYRLVGDLFFIRVLRMPNRFNVFLGLPFGMLAALGVRALLQGRRFGQKPVLLIGTLGVLILGEYCLVPYRTLRPVVPVWYKQLAAREPDHFAVLDVPMAPRYYDKRYILYQTVHGKPMLEGHVSRLPREAFTFLNSTPFLKKLHKSNEMVMDSDRESITGQLGPLAEAGVRYIILHKYFAEPKQLDAWRDCLTFDPYHEDNDLVVYRTAPRLGRDIVLTHEMVKGIGLIRVAFSPFDASQSGIIYVDARWGIAAGLERAYDICLKLINAQGKTVQVKYRPLFSDNFEPGESIDEVLRRDYILRMDPLLEPGNYSVTLGLADSATGEDVGNPAILGVVTVGPQQ